MNSMKIDQYVADRAAQAAKEQQKQTAPSKLVLNQSPAGGSMRKKPDPVQTDDANTQDDSPKTASGSPQKKVKP